VVNNYFGGASMGGMMQQNPMMQLMQMMQGITGGPCQEMGGMMPGMMGGMMPGMEGMGGMMGNCLGNFMGMQQNPMMQMMQMMMQMMQMMTMMMGGGANPFMGGMMPGMMGGMPGMGGGFPGMGGGVPGMGGGFPGMGGGFPGMGGGFPGMGGGAGAYAGVGPNGAYAGAYAGGGGAGAAAGAGTVPTGNIPLGEKPPNGRAGIEAMFGPPGQGQVTVQMPAGPGGKMIKVTCHAKIADKLKAVFEEIKAKGLSGEIKSFDGCYNNRNKRGGSSKSIHAWGIGVDINAGQHPMGSSKQTPGQRAIAEVFAKHGFKQLPNDPMHFQYATGY
jgi:hypothetical protein